MENFIEQISKFRWLNLFLAGVLEVTWACAMKYSKGFTVLIPSIITAVGYIASALFLSLALKHLPLGTAYAMWTGFGIVGTSVLGIFLFHEKLSIPQIICVIMIIAGIAGLKLLSNDSTETE
ncbi:cation/cationic drug transporter [Neocallimastix lanati (nom. inval.)]|uniref:Cation/cationic drug transporter n=1 Tax=Neocallimastix californiae TaxID=1754190 RepID=A0A1Y2FT08_9FUNG|nr:cation/cationic drug transporter [Neocallimastix sp. JGI-2020a]ORY86444.1 cation/cationic drug transporter [Neocallimastix californiae]|eukprot:ORY86444.1 cation/cationic drug transporter [Neocallimastix californiae]